MGGKWVWKWGIWLSRGNGFQGEYYCKIQHEQGFTRSDRNKAEGKAGPAAAVTGSDCNCARAELLEQRLVQTEFCRGREEPGGELLENGLCFEKQALREVIQI